MVPPNMYSDILKSTALDCEKDSGRLTEKQIVAGGRLWYEPRKFTLCVCKCLCVWVWACASQGRPGGLHCSPCWQLHKHFRVKKRRRKKLMVVCFSLCILKPSLSARELKKKLSASASPECLLVCVKEREREKKQENQFVLVWIIKREYSLAVS